MTPKGHGEKRSRLEEVAVQALLENSRIEDAATQVGVSTSTLKRWLADSNFKARLRRAQHETLERAVSRIQASAGRAVEALERNLKCGVAASEIAAARSILEYGFRGAELIDHDDRLTVIEDRLAQEERAKRYEELRQIEIDKLSGTRAKSAG